MSVKRYALDTEGDGYDFGDAIPVTVESPDGDYVRFDDYAALQSEVERLKKAHDHQYEMAGLMLREAERNGRERDEAVALLRVIDDLTPVGTDPWRGSSIQADLRAFLAKLEAKP